MNFFGEDEGGFEFWAIYSEVGLFLLFSLLMNLMSLSRAVRLHKRDEYTGEGERMPSMEKWHEVPLASWVGKGEVILCASESSTLITFFDYFPF